MNREELNDFIIKVFNYYNGRINIINNKAVLDINWCNLMTCNGYANIPNNICVNPISILHEYKDYYTMKACIIETIIHELYHLDQFIDYNLYTYDYNYNMFIEHACQLQTTIYIAGHIKEIENLFGILFDAEYYTENINRLYYPGVYYVRRTNITHIIIYLDHICGGGYYNKIYESVMYAYENKKDINLTINHKLLVICNKGEFIPIDYFNENIISFPYKNSIFKMDVLIKYDKNDNLNINAKLDLKNRMCDTIMCKKV